MCPTKTVLDVQTARKKAFDAWLISGKPKESSEGSGMGYYYPVNGNLMVFGFKVVALQFEGSPDNMGALVPNYGGLFADLDASSEAVEKLVKSRAVTLRRPKGSPALTGKRPGDQYVAVERRGKVVRFGCFILID
jgi:hypothetical protein